MNKKIFSAALFGALMALSAGTFTSCKDYDEDIDRIDTELSGIKSQLEALETKINEGKWITSVTPSTDGLTITLSDGQTYNITNGKDGQNGQDGAAGAAGTEWTISEDGYWVCNGEKTDVKAVGQDGEKGEPGQQEVKFENGKWFLWNGTEFVEFKGAATSGNIPFYYTDPNDQNYTILVVFDENGQNKKEIRLPMNEGLAQISVLNDDSYLSVNYTIAGEIKWDGAKAVPAKGDYLITQSFDSLLVQVTPTNYDLAAISSFSLVNSLNEAAPVTIGAPVAFNQVLNTKSVSKGGLYKMAVTPNKITDEDVEKYSDSDAPYLSLVANDKVRSNYEFRYKLRDCSDLSSLIIKFESGYEINLDGDMIPYFSTKPGEALTIKANDEDEEYLYDAYLTVKDINDQKADSIKWGIETGKTMTIQSNEKAQGNMVFVVHYLDVTGQVSTTDICVNFNTPSTEEIVTSIPSTPHVATAESGKNFMLVDFAPYFKDMSESDRILWNADAYVNVWNTAVKWVYTDERTGRTITEEDKYGLISSIKLADADGKELDVNNLDLSKFAKLKVTFTNNYGATQGFDLSKGEFTATVQINGAKEGVYQTVEIPFTVANPTAAEIAKQYTFNASYFANNTFTFLDVKTVDLKDYITGNIDYSGAKATDYLKFSGNKNSVVAMTTEAEIGTAYPVEGLKVNFLGRQYDIPTFNVKFVNSKAYSVNVANAAVSLVSGGSSATIFYAEKAATGKPNFYNVKDASGKYVAPASVDNIAVESANTDLVTVTKSGNDIVIATVDRVTVDTPVKVKVTATVDGEEFSAEFTVTVKAFPTE